MNIMLTPLEASQWESIAEENTNGRLSQKAVRDRANQLNYPALVHQLRMMTSFEFDMLVNGDYAIVGQGAYDAEADEYAELQER